MDILFRVYSVIFLTSNSRQYYNVPDPNFIECLNGVETTSKEEHVCFSLRIKFFFRLFFVFRLEKKNPKENVYIAVYVYGSTNSISFDDMVQNIEKKKKKNFERKMFDIKLHDMKNKIKIQVFFENE